MPLFRRRRPLHEQLAEGSDLLEWQPNLPPAPTDFTGHLDVLHGHRPREWDAVVTADADVPGAEARFVVLGDGTILLEEGADGDYSPLADAVERELQPPFRGVARRSGERIWSVGAKRLEVVELPAEVAGDDIELVAREESREVRVDGATWFGRILELESVGEQEGSDYVVRARRLEQTLWEVEASPL